MTEQLSGERGRTENGEWRNRNNQESLIKVRNARDGERNARDGERNARDGERNKVMVRDRLRE